MTKNLIRVFLLCYLCATSLIAASMDSTTPTPLTCPHCGIWQISSSNTPSLASDFVFVWEHSILIQGCGVFNFEKADVKSKKVTEQRHDYVVTAELVGRSGVSAIAVCGGDSEEEWSHSKWQLSMDISGHFRDASIGRFALTGKKTDDPMLRDVLKIKDTVLTFTAWNIDREDPCAAGSGMGSAECHRIANGEYRKALWLAADSAESKLINRGVHNTNQRRFNLTSFLAKAERYCTTREHHSGGGEWPNAWAEECIGGQTYLKRKEFLGWERCMEGTSNIEKCPYPKEDISPPRR